MPGSPNSWGTTRSVASPIWMVRGRLKPLTSEVLGDYGYWEVVAVDNDGHRWVIWSMYDIGGADIRDSDYLSRLFRSHGTDYAR
jgi:hypothetical protein